MKKLLIPVALLLTLIYSCSSKKDIEIKGFNPFANFKPVNDTLILPMDLSDAVLNGVIIPSKEQSKDGYFKINFDLTNHTGKAQNFYYKIFYQNESYKYDEAVKKGFKTIYNEKSRNNFYGSWENSNDTFHLTGEIPNDGNAHAITDSFRIAGNPRNEQKYFGAPALNSKASDSLINRTIIRMHKTPEWMKGIQEKATKNNISIDEQAYRDALWILTDSLKKGNVNNRWKDNPRVGNYSFVIVVTTKEGLDKLPETIKNISKTKDGKFVNPYYDLFNNKTLLKEKDLVIIKSKFVLKTSAKFDLSAGIYVDKAKYNNFKIDTSKYSKTCGSSSNLYLRAQFEQMFHNINRNYKLDNIPVTDDVVKNNYSQDDYFKNSAKYKKDELISDFVHITDCPCMTVSVDTMLKYLVMKNPGNNSKSMKKENVAVNSRIGFTYGKFIAKIIFPPIINKQNVWNGLTCAFWLKFQDDKEWNNRTICDSAGYLAKEDNSQNGPRFKTSYYSEIDYEILKTSKFWPKTSYKDTVNFPKDNPKSNHNIIVTCTNWDMACRSPKNFGIGAKDFSHGDKNYVIHRWDDWYKALTIKSEIEHDSLFDKPYYYEIEWQPDKIIWRIGSSKNKMIEIGYMDNSVTSIPDNQMVIVFSQEFHDSKWWPLSPFIQDLLPFPKSDIIGKILEMEVE